MSTNKATIEQIQKSLEKVLGKSVQIESKTLLRKDLGIQSIDIIDLIFVLEKQFGIRLEWEDLFEFLSKNESGGTKDILVSDLAAYIETLHKLD